MRAGRAIRLLRRLAFEPMSEFRAEQLGGPEYLGWTADTYKLTEISNKLAVNTEITRIHGSRAKAKTPESSWTPADSKNSKQKREETQLLAPSLDALNPQRLMSLVNAT